MIMHPHEEGLQSEFVYLLGYEGDKLGLVMGSDSLGGRDPGPQTGPILVFSRRSEATTTDNNSKPLGE